MELSLLIQTYSWLSWRVSFYLFAHASKPGLQPFFLNRQRIGVLPKFFIWPSSNSCELLPCKINYSHTVILQQSFLSKIFWMDYHTDERQHAASLTTSQGRCVHFNILTSLTCCFAINQSRFHFMLLHQIFCITIFTASITFLGFKFAFTYAYKFKKFLCCP